MLSHFKTAFLVGTALVLASHDAAHAQTIATDRVADPVAAEDEAATILVTGVRQAYRGNFAIAEIPQSIDVITAETLERNNILRLTDALDLNASIARQNSLGGLWDGFAVRGFAGDENLPTGYLINGFNGGRGFGGQRDVAGIERVEVLKGPAAALLGRGEPGGTVNLVTKQAQLGKSFGTTALQYGSFDTLRAEADLNIALTSALTARLIGYAEEGDTFRNNVDQRRFGFLPSIGLALGDATRITYDLELTRTEVPFDRGMIVLDGNFDTVPRDLFLGEPGDGDHVATATGHQLRLQHDFNSRWSLLLGASMRDTLLTGTSSDPELARGRQKLYTDGRSLSRQRRSRVYDTEHAVVRAELSGEFMTGSLRHRVLIGADHDSFDTLQDFRRVRPPALTATTTDRQGYVLDILNPVYGRFPRPTPGPDFNRLDTQRSTGAYVQDQIELTDRLQVRVGGRYDDVLLRTDNLLTGVLSERNAGRFSPQAGIVYRLAEPVTLYAAYGEGFRANIGTDFAGNIFAPETSISLEAGAKLTLLDGALTGTISAFQLDKNNVLATDPNNTGFAAAIGKARSRGIELDLDGRLPGDIDLLLSYAYIKAEARSSVLDPAFSFAIRPGDPLINIPDHNLNVQLSRKFTLAGRDALIGGGGQYVGERLGATGTDFFLPDHVLFRVFGQVEVADGIEMFATVANLFDEHWYASSYAELWVQPGTPRTASIGVRTSF